MELHIGKEIERVYTNSGMKISEFAKRINTSPRNVYSIFARSEIKTEQLLKISRVLNHDFFALFNVEVDKPNSEEPKGEYKTNKISIVVELDGLQTTLDQVFKRLKSINENL
ncbi:hypothetical protein WSM22_25220 [Cytophagales bacterium WSM2-2]|nr:hypothetical protein WSM22_25220 [Cytophagales bacterium WSM2-2]